MKWYLRALNHYSDFTGRARRTEYWMFTFYNFIYSALCLAFDMILAHYTGFIFFFIFYSFLMILPSLAVSARRLHDTDNSGWMYLINLVPLIGGIWFFFLCLSDSVPGSNKWGPSPKRDYF